MSSTEKIIKELEDDIKIFEEKLNVVKAFRLLLAQNTHDIKCLTKKNEDLIVENQILKNSSRSTTSIYPGEGSPND